MPIGLYSVEPCVPMPLKVGRPKRDRQKNRAQRQARKRNR